MISDELYNILYHSRMSTKSYTIKYLFKDIDSIIPTTTNNNPLLKPKIEIINGDCFQVAKLYNPNNVIIHNFANNKFQGGPCSKFTEDGKYISSEFWSNTQEDQIIRLYKDKIILPLSIYPICDNSLLPGGEGLLYSVCDNLPDVITIAALQDPNYIKKQQRQTMINRIKLILAVCAKYNKVLITGLWGCGAFGGKPVELVDLWYDALADKNIPKPQNIIFAIKIDNFSHKWGSFEDMEKIFKKIMN